MENRVDPIVSQIDLGLDHVALGRAASLEERVGPLQLLGAARRRRLEDVERLLSDIERIEATDPLILRGEFLFHRLPRGCLFECAGLADLIPPLAAVEQQLGQRHRGIKVVAADAALVTQSEPETGRSIGIHEGH